MERLQGRRLVRRSLLGLVTALAAAGACRIAAAELVDTVPSIKPSIVAVGTYQPKRNPAFRFLGTGFAVGKGLMIATNAHVLPETLAEDKLETLAIAVPGEEQSVVRRVARLALDKDRDLAVLKLDGQPLPALQLAERGSVREGQSIAFMGFPIGNALGLSPVTHRGIIAAITPIGIPQARAKELNPALIRRLSTDPFRIYQLDATAYPGNSGSPMFDPATGRVLGIVNMVFVKTTKENVLSEPSGISYAIPVEYLKALLSGLE